MLGLGIGYTPNPTPNTFIILGNYPKHVYKSTVFRKKMFTIKFKNTHFDILIDLCYKKKFFLNFLYSRFVYMLRLGA